MSATTLVSVEEYLATHYEPDCDYVDGVVEERNVGEKDHSKLQGALFAWLYERRRQLGIFVVVEQRLQVSPRRYRVPDVCVVLGREPDEQVFTAAPFLCVEVLSPEDRALRMEARIADYFTMGVEYVWVIDPQTRRGWIHSRTAPIREVADGILRAGPIELPMSELFEE
ncbi:MAG TPA: Uma2 family endonuclease [Bryobacteraceae bacterium]|nr:Uma2 family endonuclease [Bryobacteraceae bacterium]